MTNTIEFSGEVTRQPADEPVRPLSKSLHERAEEAVRACRSRAGQQ